MGPNIEKLTPAIELLGTREESFWHARLRHGLTSLTSAALEKLPQAYQRFADPGINITNGKVIPDIHFGELTVPVLPEEDGGQQALYQRANQLFQLMLPKSRRPNIALTLVNGRRELPVAISHQLILEATDSNMPLTEFSRSVRYANTDRQPLFKRSEWKNRYAFNGTNISPTTKGADIQLASENYTSGEVIAAAISMTKFAKDLETGLKLTHAETVLSAICGHKPSADSSYAQNNITLISGILNHYDSLKEDGSSDKPFKINGNISESIGDYTPFKELLSSFDIPIVKPELEERKLKPTQELENLIYAIDNPDKAVAVNFLSNDPLRTNIAMYIEQLSEGISDENPQITFSVKQIMEELAIENTTPNRRMVNGVIQSVRQKGALTYADENTKLGKTKGKYILNKKISFSPLPNANFLNGLSEILSKNEKAKGSRQLTRGELDALVTQLNGKDITASSLTNRESRYFEMAEAYGYDDPRAFYIAPSKAQVEELRTTLDAWNRAHRRFAFLTTTSEGREFLTQRFAEKDLELDGENGFRRQLLNVIGRYISWAA